MESDRRNKEGEQNARRLGIREGELRRVAGPVDAREDPIRCSFCSSAAGPSKRLVKGPGDVAICDACVNVCLSILAGDVTTGD